jgi:hypothetical protein
VVLHHLDRPRRPVGVAQREGQILRQGNRNDQSQEAAGSLQRNDREQQPAPNDAARQAGRVGDEGVAGNRSQYLIDCGPVRSLRPARLFAAGRPARVRRQSMDMALQLAPEEPEAGPWRVELLSSVIEAMIWHGPAKAISGRPAVLAIDGRSNAGKTTLAARICRVVPGSAVVHTDDIAWKHSRFGWADLLIEGILEPVHQGLAVSYRPPRWAERGREGSISIPADWGVALLE